MARRTAREQGITLSAPAWTWATLLVLAAAQFWLGVSALTGGPMEPWFGWLCLCLGCASTARAWRLGRLRVYMTSDAVTVRGGLRRRTIAWQDIRTIEERRRSWLSDRVVEIAPNTGKPITALVKASWLDDTFERDRRDLERRWRARTSASADGSPVPPHRPTTA